jgi:hypothetical protein
LESSNSIRTEQTGHRIVNIEHPLRPLSGLLELFGSGRFGWGLLTSGKEKAGFGKGVSTSQRNAA